MTERREMIARSPKLQSGADKFFLTDSVNYILAAP